MTDDNPTAREIFEVCVCLGVQRAARGLARRYDEALVPAGMTSGQFAILSALLRDDPVPLTELAGLLGLERTTLTRNLAPLEAAGLALSTPTSDRRVRALTLTNAGRDRLESALPLWHAAQADSARRLDAGWAAVRPALARLA